MSLKIKNEDDRIDDKNVKHFKSDVDPELKLFMDWCKDVGIQINYSKVKITKCDTSHNYGMIAIQDLKENECIVNIPKSSLLEACNTEIKGLIEKNKEKLKSESNWSKLIISLMYECSINEKSKWLPYLKLFPNYKYLDLPMFWDENELKHLSNTPVYKNVKSDLTNMKNEFDNIILPFIKENKSHFNDKCMEFDYYKKLVAFIMSYSFTDPNENGEESEQEPVGPVMVPVADILNHIAKNNAEIRFKETELQICTTRSIKKDVEVYNTYGEHSNTNLLHMYGFVEVHPNNIYDNVEIPSKCLIDAMISIKNDHETIRKSKINVFYELNLIDDNSSFIIGDDGILNEEESVLLCQIYTMSPTVLNEFIENEYELEEETEGDDYSLTKDGIKTIPLDWRNLILESCNIHLTNLKKDMDDITKMCESITNEITKSRIEKIKILLEGHINLLNEFLN